MTAHIDTANPVARATFLRRVLQVDAATCLGTGALLALGAGWLERYLGLPAWLLFHSGLSLFPIAAFMGWVATRAPVPVAGVRLIVWGNAAWVLASLLVLGVFSPTSLGHAFVLAQAAVVALLARLEHGALP
jgi:hypothetical protein